VSAQSWAAQLELGILVADAEQVWEAGPRWSFGIGAEFCVAQLLGESWARRRRRRYRLSVGDPAQAISLCRAVPGIRDVTLVGEQIEFSVDDDDALLRVTRALVEARLVIYALMPEQLTLERVFFELTEAGAAHDEVAA
jgi:hypothetical protein